MTDQEIKAKAERLLKYLRSDTRYDLTHQPRPFFIELTGSPSAGKTSAIKALYSFLRRLGFKVWIPQEGAEVIQHIPRSTPEYNIRTGMYALTILVDQSYAHNYDIVILDRGIFDAYCWMIYWASKGKLNFNQTTNFQSFFLSDFWKDRIDAAYFVTCDPEIAVQRERQGSITDDLGESTSPFSIRESINRHQIAYSQLKAANPQLFLINSTNLDRKELGDLIAKKTLEILEEKIKSNP